MKKLKTDGDVAGIRNWCLPTSSPYCYCCTACLSELK